MPTFLLKPAPHKEAAAFIASKPVIAREAFDHLLPDLKARAFTITGVESANVMQAVRDRIAEIPQGADWDLAKQDIVDKISPWLDPEDPENTASTRRAELLLRNHGFQSYAVANDEVMDRQKDAFPYAQYLGVDDERERDSHRALNDLVLPVDDPFWLTHTGPWDWGCRCLKVPMTGGDVADMQAADAKKPPEAQRVVTGARLRALQEGRLITAGPGGMPQFINVAPNPSYTFNPKTLRMDVDQLQARYSDEVWSAFKEWAQGQPLEGGGDVWSWLGGKPSTSAIAAAATTAVTPSAPAGSVEEERAAIRAADYKTETDFSGGVNTTLKLTNGRTVVFKPGAGEDMRKLRIGVQPGTQYRREVAASLLDEQLGLGLVPPTTLLVRNGVEGSAQLFKEGFREAGALRPREMYATIAKLPERTLQDWQLFDDLTAHLDRHAKNYLLRVRGDTAELALIDNGLSFPAIAQRKQYPGPREGQPIDATNLARLRDLLAHEAELTEKLRFHLERAAVKLLFDRARILLERKTYGDTHT